MGKTRLRWRLSKATLLATAMMLHWGIELAGAPSECRAAETLPTDLACLSPTMEGFACLDVAQLWNSKPLEQVRDKLAVEVNTDLRFQKEMGVAVEQIERVSFVTTTFRDLSAPVVLVRTRRPYDRERVLATVGPRPKKEKVGGRTICKGSGRDAWCLLDERTFAFGPPLALGQCLQLPEETKGGLMRAALKLAGEKHLLVMAARWAPLAAELRRRMPPQIEPFKELLNAQSSLLVIDFDEKLKADLRVSFASEAGAALKPIRGLLQAATRQLALALPRLRQEGLALFVPQTEAVQAGLQQVSAEQRGKEVHLQGSVEVAPRLGPVVMDLARRMREAAKRIESLSYLRQIALAMHSYHQAYGQLPTQAIFGKDGKPLLSWRVAILPYIDQEDLYKQFHLDEPWDSEHNKKLLARMPAISALRTATRTQLCVADRRAKRVLCSHESYHRRGRSRTVRLAE